MPELNRSAPLSLEGSGFELDSRFFAYHSRFLPTAEASRLTQLFWQELSWARYELTLFGRRVAQPRLTAWYGDPAARYRYSGLELEPLPWHPELLRLKNRLQDFLGEPFNSTLANAYRNGRDSMGWHADDEKELGNQPLVASISLGAERRFLVRHNSRRGSAGIWLESGSLLVMKRGCQQRYQHSLPKTRSVDGLRINLTYRNIVA
jgi:alkylated DNA repair dioxygenase AlkB